MPPHSCWCCLQSCTNELVSAEMVLKCKWQCAHCQELVWQNTNYFACQWALLTNQQYARCWQGDPATFTIISITQCGYASLCNCRSSIRWIPLKVYFTRRLICYWVSTSWYKCKSADMGCNTDHTHTRLNISITDVCYFKHGFKPVTVLKS